MSIATLIGGGSQEFRRRQTLIGECTLSGSGEIKIIVT